MFHRNPHIKQKLQEMNDNIGAELALSLMRKTAYRVYALVGLGVSCCPCIFIPATVYVKTCDPNSSVRKNDAKILESIKKNLKANLIHRSDITDKHGNLLDENFLITMQQTRAQAVQDILAMFKNLKSDGAQTFYSDLPDYVNEGIRATKDSKEIVQKLQSVSTSSRSH